MRFGTVRSSAFATALCVLTGLIVAAHNVARVEAAEERKPGQSIDEIEQLLLKLGKVNTAVDDPGATKNAEDCDEPPRRDFENCPSMKTGAISGLRENWALESSGADLLRGHRALAGADYAATHVGVIDTGLKVKGNRYAGKRLQDNSPEIEYGCSGHGTHVAGIVSSQEFGVNPDLEVTAFPTLEFSNCSGWGGGGFNGAALLQSIRKAADDPKVRVINMSISNPEDSENRKAILYALSKGKWVVNAAGNAGKVVDASAAGLVSLSKEPGFFSIGSLSPFASPSDFSNYGPSTKFFVPGSFIRSLNSRYNPNVTGVPEVRFEKATMGGTSMAAPHFSAVLATLLALEPRLTPTIAEDLLRRTSILRGPGGEVRQANPFLAVMVLERAKTCANPTTGPDRKCIDGAIEAVGKETARGIEQEFNAVGASPNNCASFDRRFRRLRELYFLSKGDGRIGQQLTEFLRGSGLMDDLSLVYFARSAAVAGQRLNDVTGLQFRGDTEARRIQLSSEAATAKGFLAGEGLVKENTALLLGPLAELHPDIENVPVFLKHCLDEYRNPSPKEVSVRIGSRSSQCRRFLQSAPQAFRFKVAETMAHLGNTATGVEGMFLGDDHPSLEVRRDLIRNAIRGLAANPEKLDAFASLIGREPPRVLDLPLAERLAVTKMFRRMSADGTFEKEMPTEPRFQGDSLETLQKDWKAYFNVVKAKAELLDPNVPWDVPSLYRAVGHPDPEGTSSMAAFDPDIKRFVAASLRSQSSDGKEAAAMLNLVLDKAAKGTIDEQGGMRFPNGNLSEWGGSLPNTTSILRMLKSPAGREAVLGALRNKEKITGLLNIADVPKILLGVLPTVSPAERRVILRTAINDEAKRKYPRVIYTLQNLDPGYAKELMDGKVTSLGEIRAREVLLALHAQSASRVDEYVRAFFNENQAELAKDMSRMKATAWLSDDPQLAPRTQAILKQQIEKSKTDPEVAQTLAYFIYELPGNDLRKFVKLAKGDVVRLTLGSDAPIERSMLSAVVEDAGANRATMIDVVRQLGELTTGRDLDKADPGARRGLSDTTGQKSIFAMQMIATASQGAAALEASPEIAERLANWMADGGNKGFTLLDRSLPVPDDLLRALKARMPKRLADFPASDRLPRWFTDTLERLPADDPQLMAYVNEANAAKNERWQADLFYAAEKASIRAENKNAKP